MQALHGDFARLCKPLSELNAPYVPHDSSQYEPELKKAKVRLPALLRYPLDNVICVCGSVYSHMYAQRQACQLHNSVHSQISQSHAASFADGCAAVGQVQVGLNLEQALSIILRRCIHLQVQLAPVQKAAVSREISRQANFAKSAKGSSSIKSFFGKGKS